MVERSYRRPPVLEWVVENTDMIVEVRVWHAEDLGEAKAVAVELFERALRARR